MRFKSKYNHGQERIIEKFLWFPVSIKPYDIKETRWLERARICQRYYAFGSKRGWRNKSFENK